MTGQGSQKLFHFILRSDVSVCIEFNNYQCKCFFFSPSYLGAVNICTKFHGCCVFVESGQKQ